ncbi:MAG: hypothetical protein AAF840_14640 [Bacteroidota bacterium]
MDYLDYLADHTYEALPAEIRATISQEDYDARRQLVLALAEPPATELPPVLAAALAETTMVNKEARPRLLSGVEVQGAESPTRATGAVPQGEGKNSKVRWLPWLAAAGWLLFLAVSSVLLLREPETRLVKETIFAPAPAPKIVYTTDTLYQTRTAYKYRTEVVHDTVYQQVPVEKLVLVRDTVYLPAANRTQLVRGSSSLSGKERMIGFFYGTE